MSEKPKSCPFCGGEATVNRGRNGKANRDGFYVTAVFCLNIDCIGNNFRCLCYGKKTSEAATEAWNRRDGEGKNCDLEVQGEPSTCVN